MEIKILEESKKKIKFLVKGEDHTLCNALVKELWNDDSVKAAAYRTRHPLVGSPEVYVEADDDVRKVILEAVKRLKKANEKFKEELVKKLKA